MIIIWQVVLVVVVVRGSVASKVYVHGNAWSMVFVFGVDG